MFRIRLGSILLEICFSLFSGGRSLAIEDVRAICTAHMQIYTPTSFILLLR